MNPQSQLSVLMCTIVLIHLPKKMDDSEYHDDVPINPNHSILEGTLFLIISEGILNSAALEILWSQFSAKVYFNV